MSTPSPSTDATSSASSIPTTPATPPPIDPTPAPSPTPVPAPAPTTPLSPAASLLCLIESSHDPIIFVESSDHMLLALPLPIARRCHALITKHLHADLTEHGTALVGTVTGEAMQRCVGYVAHEWAEIEKRKEKLAVIMKARGQKGSDKMGVGGIGEGQEKEGGGRRGKDRERNLLASVARAQQQLINYFQAMSSSHPNPSPSLPQFPPQALGVSPPSYSLASLLAPSSSVPTSPPSLAYSINHLLCELASSAYYLEIPPLVDLTCQRLADSIQGKSAEEIRTTFNITNDFTPMEEVQVQARVMERTLLYPGGIDDGRPGGPPVGEEERGLMAGLQAGLGGAAGAVAGVGGSARLGVREQLKVKLAEKRMAQMRERGLLGPASLPTRITGLASSEERKVETRQAVDSADASGAAGGSSSAAKKKKKKKAKKKGKSAEGEEEKEPSSPPSPTSPSLSSAQSSPHQQQRLSVASEDEQKAMVDGSTYQFLQSMASSLTTSVAALPCSNTILEGKPVDSSTIASRSPTVAATALAMDAAASTLRQFTVADLCDPHEPPQPLFPPRTYPEPTWHHLRLLLKCAMSTSGLQWLRPYFPNCVHMYVGLTMGPSSASPLLHVCFDSDTALVEAVQSQLLGVLFPLLYAPPTVLSNMWEMWSSGRLMRCCDWCGLAGHMRGWEGCGMKDEGDSYVSRSLAVMEANPPPAQLMTLRFVFRLSLTSGVLIPLSGLLPHALFLHLGFHPLYSTPTHVLHVTFSSSSTMQTCLLSDVPSILHLMHTPPRIHLMDVSGYDVRDACPQCGEMGRHNGGVCDVERDSRGLDPLSPAMLPPTSFAAFAAASAPPSATLSQQPHILTALSRVIDAGKGEDETKRGGVAESSEPNSDEEDEDNVDDSRPLSELIDAKLMGLQHWEQHQQHSSSSTGSEHGIDVDKAVAEMVVRSNAADESAFSASTLSSFFCSCPSPPPSIPLSSSALMSDLARCPFSPLLLNTMSLCSHCGLLLSSASTSASPSANASLTADMQAMLMDADPAVLASLPYPLSAMFQKEGARVEEQKDSEVHRREASEEEVDEGVRSIQMHSVGLPPLLHAAPSDDDKTSQPARDPAPHQQSLNPPSSSSHAPSTHSASTTPTSSTSTSPPSPATHPARPSAPSSCSDCLRLQSQLTDQSSFSSKLLRLVEEQQKALAALQDRVKKTEEREVKRREKWEERVKAIERMDERLKAMEKQDGVRKDAAQKMERRMADETKRRLDIERWVEEETREKEERQRRDRREKELRADEEKRDSERREAEEKKERGDMRRLQSKWAEWERKRESQLTEQWSELTARLEREREKDRAELRAGRDREREDERRRSDDRLLQHSSQLQLHGDVLVRVDRKLQSMEQMLLTSDRVISRQRMAELIGFDVSDQ